MKDFVISAKYVDWNDEDSIEELLCKYREVITEVAPTASTDGEIENNFYSLCSLMEDNGSNNPQKYNVIQFYSKLNYINEKIEAQNKANG